MLPQLPQSWEPLSQHQVMQTSIISDCTLQWRHNEHDGVSNDQLCDCLHNRLFRCRSNKTSKLRVTGLWAGNSPVTGEFPTQRASNAENISIWLRHHDFSDFPVADNRSLAKASDAELWCFLWSVSEQKFEQTIETPVIWDAIAPIMTSMLDLSSTAIFNRPIFKLYTGDFRREKV